MSVNQFAALPGRHGSLSLLHRLAGEYGIQVSHREVTGHRRQATADTLLRLLRSLGAPMERMSDAAAALREIRQARAARVLEPVVVASDGVLPPVTLRMSGDASHARHRMTLSLEQGEATQWDLQPAALPTKGKDTVEGVRIVDKLFTLREVIPQGYHRLTLQGNSSRHEALVISAPRAVYAGDGGERQWGVFLPLYALHADRSWGAGDLSDLQALQEWISGLGGGLVATLPLLAAYLDDPFEPSPYSPASRLFWNEFYLDPGRAPEMAKSERARSRMETVLAGAAKELRAAPLVDYRRQMELKRSVLEELAMHVYSEKSARLGELLDFAKAHPAADDYARFRAAIEQQGRPWRQWPPLLRDGALGPADYDETNRRYHLYVQWLAQEQMSELAKRFRAKGPGLYLDLPLGLHRQAYDIWRNRSLFLDDLSGGAPPDSVFVKGQNWAFPPLHPERIREQGYGYVIDYLGQSMRHAGILRIDHIMGLHRIYCIPEGFDGEHGAYLRYPAEEYYAILSLESHRNQCRIAGENLGTVPAAVNGAMKRHGVQELYVVQYELDSARPGILRPAPAKATASLNTHDMYPFSGYLRAHDLEVRKDLGLLSASEMKAEQKTRAAIRKKLTGFLKTARRLGAAPDDQALLSACLAHLCAGRAWSVLANLEDLWLETEPQNVPGTSQEYSNWRRRARLSLEQMKESPEIAAILAEMERLRKSAAS